MNIILTGFMGTGKSAVGQRVAEKLGRRFIDMDELIEERAKKPIPRIFKEDGEDCFRKMERALAKELSQKCGIVVAAGGGLVLNPENIVDFSRSGLVICLYASLEVLAGRLSTSSNRPLLENGDRMTRISRLMKARKSLYDSIPCRIDTSSLTVEDVANRVISEFNSLDTPSPCA